MLPLPYYLSLKIPCTEKQVTDFKVTYKVLTDFFGLNFETAYSE